MENTEINKLTKKYIDELTYSVIGAAIEVHREMGAGLKESIYEECMTMELDRLGINYQQQYSFKPFYKGTKLKTNSIIDLLVEDLLVVELKSVSALLRIHDAQILNYINLLKKPKGVLLNFNAYNLARDGKKTLVNDIYAQLPDE